MRGFDNRNLGNYCIHSAVIILVPLFYTKYIWQRVYLCGKFSYGVKQLIFNRKAQLFKKFISTVTVHLYLLSITVSYFPISKFVLFLFVFRLLQSIAL